MKITNLVNVPTIGIGSSKNCDGQILVTDDLIGLSGFYPKFVKKYLDLQKHLSRAIKNFTKDVKSNTFLTKSNILIKMNQEVIEKKSLIDLLKANSKLITFF